MGQTLVRMVRDDPEMVLVGATERKGSPHVGIDVGLATRLGIFELPVRDSLAKALDEGRAQVVIDFTSAEASVEHARICAERGVALVVGSTGFSAEARAEVMLQSRKIPIVMSPNMSVGVNLVIKVAAELARVLGEGFDIEVVETHHRMKKDAPSGTALRMAEEIARAVGRSHSDIRTERSGQIGERPAREIGIQTVRGGDVVGEHTVLFLGDGERVELTHRATSRDQFGRGALRAAKWVVGRVPGHYDMADVLGLR
ncbi:MAG: 4-hydroxy-tetrahydrodipicolinate reductase [Myxococcaceae bacterium]|nr:4-hydroxy-tetrahydrodipicolinate reductase [Myxococcaceae bacterium]